MEEGKKYLTEQELTHTHCTSWEHFLLQADSGLRKEESCYGPSLW